MRVRKSFHTFFIMLSVSMLLSACGGGGQGNDTPLPDAPALSITISPPTAALRTGETQLFSATVTGASSNAVLWHLEEGNLAGTIDANGLYRASSIGGTYHVVVASQADATQTASAVVTVTQANVVTPPPVSAPEIPSTSPGSLDITFGKSGKVTTSPGFGSDTANAIVLQTLQQGVKTLVVGHAFNGEDNDFLLIRYNGDGSLDTSFGNGGKVLTDFGSDDNANAVAIDSTGRIIVAGYAYNGRNYDFAVARYNALGGLDTTFGASGKVLTPIGTGDDYAVAVIIRADGSILVAGNSQNSNNYDFALALYNDLGILKNGFGSNGNGKVTTSVGNSDDFAFTAGLQLDGKIIVAGDTYNGHDFDFAMVRYSSNGILDSTFSATGKMIASIGASHDVIRAMAITTNKIIVAGFVYNANDPDIALARYNISDGSLDTGFGNQGISITPIGTGEDLALALQIQHDDNKLVIGGKAFNGIDTDFVIARYDVDGTLDSTFGDGGKTTTDFNNGNDTISVITIQDDGKILAAGNSVVGTNRDLALARYTANGALDTTFKAGGKQTLNLEKSSSSAQSIAIQDDGKIIAAGDSFDGDISLFTLVRYGISGEIDLTFGENGKRATSLNGGTGGGVILRPDGKIFAAGTVFQNNNNDFGVALYDTNGTYQGIATIGFGPNGTNADHLAAIALQPDGKVLVAGRTRVGGFDDFALARFDNTGNIDSSFGTGGTVITQIGTGNDGIDRIALQADGKIIVAGYSVQGSIYNFVLARYHSDGSLDTSFGTGGKVLTPVGASGYGVATVVRIQPDGKILAGGYTENNNNDDFALVRYHSDGTLDPTFGKNGKVTTPMDTGNDGIYDLALQPDGKIVAAGYSNVLNSDFAMARYNADGTLDSSFGQSGKKTTAIGGSSDFIFAVALQSDGKIVAAGGSWAGTHYEFALARFWP